MSTESAPLPTLPERGGRGPLAGFVPAFLWGLRITFRWRRMALIGGLGVALGVLLGSLAVGQTYSRRPHDEVLDLWLLLDKQLLHFLLPVIVLMTVARGFSSEISSRTLVYHLVRPISRSTLLLARFFSGVVAATLLSTLVLGSTCLASGVALPVEVWLSLPVTALIGALAVGSFYYAVSALFRHGMIAALIYTFVFEPLFSGQRGMMQKLSIMFHVRGVHHGMTDEAFADLSRNVALASDASGADAARKLLSEANLSALMEIREKLAYDPPATAALIVVCITTGILGYACWRIARRDFALKD